MRFAFSTPVPRRSVRTESDVQHSREQREALVAGAICAMPIILFVLLRWLNPSLDAMVIVPTQHFYLVSAACLGALGMALVLGWAAVRTREPRTWLLATTYISVAAPFAVHGLMTPGQMFSDEFYGSMSVSAQLSLLCGCVLILLASRPLPRGVADFVSAQFGAVMVATVLLAAGYIVACLSFHTLLDWVPTGAEPAGIKTIFGLDRHDVGWTIRWLVLAIGLACSLTAARTFYRSFATSRSLATAAVMISAVLFGESLFVQTFGAVWFYSWWIYHVTLFVAVVLPMAAIAWLYRSGRTLLDIVDALLLTETLAKVEYSMPVAIDTLVRTVEQRDPYLKGHMRRVCELSVAIAERVGVTDVSVRATGYAALLHDIGKLGLPGTILHKAGPLTDAEFATMKEHPGRGFALVSNVHSLRTAAPAIRWHHERLDGTGYPDGLQANEIPVEARIIAVADVWDALTSDRSYRAAMDWQAARRILVAERGGKLDSQCVDALLDVIERRTGRSEPEPELASVG